MTHWLIFLRLFPFLTAYIPFILLTTRQQASKMPVSYTHESSPIAPSSSPRPRDLGCPLFLGVSTSVSA